MKVFGIDFGTSNSSVSLCHGNQVQLLSVDPENPISNSLKSILYFNKEAGQTRSYVGYEGVKAYMANEAEGRYMQSIKTFLPHPGFEKTSVFGKTYTLEELISFFLKTMKERGEIQIGEAVDHLVLGRPVIFSEDPERESLATARLLEAARLAGFKETVLQMEPIAAALSYENALPQGREEIVLVGDFGAGSSDFTILRAKNTGRPRGDRKEDILATGGVYIGGDNFDSAIMRHRIAPWYGTEVRVKSMLSDNITGLSPLVIRKLLQWHHIPQLGKPSTLSNIRELKVTASLRDKKRLENLENLISANYGYLLFRAIEAAKCRLSDAPLADVVFKDYGMAIEEEILRDEFNEMIAQEAQKIEACVDETLSKATLSPRDIDVVFLTGGSSYIPRIRSIFEQKIGMDKIRTSDAFTSVAYGLGLFAGMMAR